MSYCIIFYDNPRNTLQTNVTYVDSDTIERDFTDVQRIMQTYDSVYDTLFNDNARILERNIQMPFHPKPYFTIYRKKTLPQPALNPHNNTHIQRKKGPWTIDLCKELVEGLNEGSLFVSPNQPDIQSITLLVLPPTQNMKESISACLLEIQKAQEQLIQATKDLDNALRGI